MVRTAHHTKNGILVFSKFLATKQEQVAIQLFFW